MNAKITQNQDSNEQKQETNVSKNKRTWVNSGCCENVFLFCLSLGQTMD